jgi:hypothetical protein
VTRAAVDAARVHALLEALAGEAGGETTVYLVGGATAVTVGWRATTIDIDLRMEPEDEAALRALPRLKDDLGINVELASPFDFLPELPGWRDRSPYVVRIAQMTVRQLDPYAQALAKLERGFGQDLIDVDEMVARGLVRPTELARLFEAVAEQLYRFPAVDPGHLRAAVEALSERSSRAS